MEYVIHSSMANIRRYDLNCSNYLTSSVYEVISHEVLTTVASIGLNRIVKLD